MFSNVDNAPLQKKGTKQTRNITTRREGKKEKEDDTCLNADPRGDSLVRGESSVINFPRT